MAGIVNRGDGGRSLEMHSGGWAREGFRDKVWMWRGCRLGRGLRLSRGSVSRVRCGGAAAGAILQVFRAADTCPADACLFARHHNRCKETLPRPKHTPLVSPFPVLRIWKIPLPSCQYDLETSIPMRQIHSTLAASAVPLPPVPIAPLAPQSMESNNLPPPSTAPPPGLSLFPLKASETPSPSGPLIPPSSSHCEPLAFAFSSRSSQNPRTPSSSDRYSTTAPSTPSTCSRKPRFVPNMLEKA